MRIALVLVGVVLVLLGVLLILRREAIDRWCGRISARVGWDLYREGAGVFAVFGSAWLAIGLAGMWIALFGKV